MKPDKTEVSLENWPNDMDKEYQELGISPVQGLYINTLIMSLLDKQREEFARKVWNDEELQSTIADYGEWDKPKIDQAFENVLSRLLS